MESLEALESRIRKAVEIVGQLRAENESLRKELGEARGQGHKAAELASEVETLRAERESVRKRLEKLLDTIDQMNA